MRLSIRLFEGWSRIFYDRLGGNHILSVYDGATAEAGSTTIAVTSWWTNDDTVPRNSSVAVAMILNHDVHATTGGYHGYHRG